jgi:hypothetical protein
MLSLSEYLLEKKKDPCWTGYKKVAGKKDYEEDSCVKEESDLEEGKSGLWANIHAKQERIKNGSGEKMRKPGSKGAPTADALKASQTNESLKGGQKKLDKNHNGVLDGQDFAIIRNKKTKNEEVEEQFDMIEQVIEELALAEGLDSEFVWETLEFVTDEELLEYAIDKKGHKSSTGGLTQKGRDSYNSKGAHLKAPVTTSPSKLKKGSKAANRRKSFCARMSGVDGPMKKPNGEPSRKALALRKWNC